MRKVFLIICLFLFIGCSQKDDTVDNKAPEKVVLNSQFGKVYILQQGEIVDSEKDLTEEEIALLEKRINVVNFNFYHITDKKVNMDSYEHIDLMTNDENDAIAIVLCEPYIKYGDKIYNLGYDHEIFNYSEKMIKERKN
ncbi:MAG: hypothetical protein Q4C64_04650 [Erysipelotrichia bacterium]|nr:hypothetical protein [Erysipelotrichia bacterium]